MLTAVFSSCIRATMELGQGVSPELLAANARLLTLRANRTVADKAPQTQTIGSPPPTAVCIHQLPAHLGWGSAPVTAACRRHQSATTDDEQRTVKHKSVVGCLPPAPALILNNQTTKLYPDIAQAILKNELSGAARLWLLLRQTDSNGQGWLRIDVERARLCDKQSAAYFCGWRQFRNLLAQGEGVFWTRDSERIWLRGVVAVARTLGVKRLQGCPVQLPLTAVYGGVGLFRAHLYASFHSGRTQTAPISRAQLRQQSGVAGRTQRHYDKRARVQRTRNVAVGQIATNVSWETTAWQQGGGVFALKDQNGRFGPPHQTYIAWQMPNSYSGPHRRCGRGRQKKVNQRLADLVHTGMRGNGRRQQFLRRYHRSGKTAVRQQHPHATYWPNQPTKPHLATNSLTFWHALSPL